MTWTTKKLSWSVIVGFPLLNILGIFIILATDPWLIISSGYLLVSMVLIPVLALAAYWTVVSSLGVEKKRLRIATSIVIVLSGLPHFYTWVQACMAV